VRKADVLRAAVCDPARHPGDAIPTGKFWKRFSLVGFGGPAMVWNSTEPSRRQYVVSGCAGVRYLLARKFGLHDGVDVARSQKVGPRTFTSAALR